MIDVSVSTVAGAAGKPCTSGCDEHGGSAILSLFVGDPAQEGEAAAHLLCEKCAHKTVNALALMLSSATGKSIPSLLGWGRAKRK